MSALEETPRAPAPDPAMKWIAGCGFGCLALVVLVVVAAVAVVSWFGREGPPRAEEILVDGGESAALTVDLRADDPAVVDLLTGLQDQATKVGAPEARVKLPPFFQNLRREDLRRSLPVRFEVVRWPAEGEGAEPWIVRLTLGQGAWKARFTMRLFSWVFSRGNGAHRETIDGVEVLVVGPAEDALSAAVVGNRVLVSREASTLRRVLRGGGPAEPGRRALVEAVRLDGEDGVGYLLPEGDAALTLAAASFDVASRDVVRFRAALRSPTPPEDPQAAARAIEERLTTFLGFKDLRVVREGEPYWLDPTTLVIEGRVEGIEGLLASFFSATTPDAANP